MIVGCNLRGGSGSTIERTRNKHVLRHFASLCYGVSFAWLMTEILITSFFELSFWLSGAETTSYFKRYVVDGFSQLTEEYWPPLTQPLPMFCLSDI